MAEAATTLHVNTRVKSIDDSTGLREFLPSFRTILEQLVSPDMPGLDLFRPVFAGEGSITRVTVGFMEDPVPAHLAHDYTSPAILIEMTLNSGTEARLLFTFDVNMKQWIVSKQVGVILPITECISHTETFSSAFRLVYDEVSRLHYLAMQK